MRDMNDDFDPSEIDIDPSAGKPRRRSKPALSQHVPVRFAPDLIAVVKVLAAEEGVSVSTWIRTQVEREARRRSAPVTRGAENVYVVRREIESEPVFGAVGETQAAYATTR